MTDRRISYRRQSTGFLLLLSFLLVGCVGQMGTSWPSLTLLEDGRTIVFAHEQTLKLVDVVEGETVTILEDGDPVINEDGEPQQWLINGGDYDGAEFFGAPIQIEEQSLLVPVADGRLMQIEIPSARVVSEPITVQARGNLTTDLAQSGNQILVGLQNELLAIDSENLERDWSIETDHAVWAEPIRVDNTLYFASLDHFMYAVDAETGQEQWRLDLEGAATATPAYDANLEQFYIGTFNSEVLAISRAGEIVNRFATDGWVWGEPLLIDEGDETKLYVADLSGFVYKLNPQDLSPVEEWPVAARPTDAAIRMTPTVFGEYVVVGSRDQRLYYIDREDGNVNENLTRTLDGEILTDILHFSADDIDGLEEDLLVVSTMSDREALVGFTANTGERIWTIRQR